VGDTPGVAIGVVRRLVWALRAWVRAAATCRRAASLLRAMAGALASAAENAQGLADMLGNAEADRLAKPQLETLPEPALLPRRFS
jgi:hypothetical protein